MDETLKKLSLLPYFKMSHLETFLSSLKSTSLRQKVSRWLRKGEIVELKKGFYVAKEYREKHISDPNYLYYLANILRYPSYVSGVYVLQRKGVLTEMTYPVTSITTKSTRSYANELGEFVYNSISPKLYLGYERLSYRDEPVYVATLAKALFDYLYIRYARTKISLDEILTRERLNLDVFSKKDIKEFRRYCRISGRKTLIELGFKIFSKV